MSSKLLAPIKVTDSQRKWLEVEQKRTGNAFSTIMRGLIQDQIDSKKSVVNG